MNTGQMQLIENVKIIQNKNNLICLKYDIIFEHVKCRMPKK